MRRRRRNSGFSTLAPNVTFAHLVRTAKLRWRIERDYLELKPEIGLGHFEGRGWRGFHHHATLCIAAYAFLVAERATFPPRKRVAVRSSKCLPFPKITGRGVLPIRRERHVPDSIATLRREIAVRLAALLDRCPCCSQPRSNQKNRSYFMFDAVGLTRHATNARLHTITSCSLHPVPAIMRANLYLHLISFE
jgi:hypothetical protein